MIIKDLLISTSFVPVAYVLPPKRGKTCVTGTNDAGINGSLRL